MEDSEGLATESFPENVMSFRTPDGEPPDAMAERGQVGELLQGAVEHLPAIDRRVFILRAVEDMSVEETAFASVSATMWSRRASCGRAMLRESLAEQMKPHLHNKFSFAGQRCDAVVSHVLGELHQRGLIRSHGSTFAHRVKSACGRDAQIIPLAAAMNFAEPKPQVWLQDDPDRQPDRVAMRSEIRQLMEARIDLLPDTFRSIFVLRAVEELSVEEVTQALEISEATVRPHFFRARNLLREGLSSDIDASIGNAFAFDGERCYRIVVAVLAPVAADRESPMGSPLCSRGRE